MRYIKRLVKDLLLRFDIFRYNTWYESIKREIFKKEKINVAFFVLYDSMWKSDKLFEYLLNDIRFNPYIVSVDSPYHPELFRKENQKKLEVFFKQKGFPFFKGYDFESNQWLDINALSPDIVVYPQPNYSGYKGFNIKSLWKRCIFLYIPYCYRQEKSYALHNTLLKNIAWKMFYPDMFHINEAKRLQFNKGANVVLTGYPLADDLSKPCKSVHAKKIVIWAPHHSILPDDTLRYSTFLEVYDSMIEISKKYEDDIQIVFKPHPSLKRKLYKMDGWGIERTNSYYAYWANSKNTSLSEGDYIDLFLESDAMIHDCSSFSGEYLYTQKPVMFLAKPNHESYLSEFGRMCYEQHYKGITIGEIESFIENVVLAGLDPMKEGRKIFFEKYLVSPGNNTVANNMYNEFVKELK